MDLLRRYYSSLEVASEYFRSGADKVSIGSDAVYAAEEYLKSGVCDTHLYENYCIFFQRKNASLFTFILTLFCLFVLLTVFEGENWKEQSRADLPSLWKSGLV